MYPLQLTSLIWLKEHRFIQEYMYIGYVKPIAEVYPYGFN